MSNWDGKIEQKIRRNNIEIMVDILQNMKKQEMNKTLVVYKANLNFKRAERYLEMMLKMELIEYLDPKYKITDKGIGYLQKINEINSFFSNLGD